MSEARRPPPPPEVLGAPWARGAEPDRRSAGGKNWDRRVRQADELAHSAGFRELRNRILARAAPSVEDRVLDVGSGTGLLALAVAPQCRGVWAIDVAPAMVEHLRWVVAGQGLDNVYPLVASATSLPLEDGSVDLVLSNYCFHHLTEPEKRKAAAEAFRVLRPGGRFVFGDMMFGWSLGIERNRTIVRSKLRALVRRGPAGWWRILSNLARLLGGRGERPAPAEWWRGALLAVGFDRIRVELLPHEGGIASANKPG
jgi:SAM-dependent methyltransferase